MKIAIALFILVLTLTPSTAFGWKSISSHYSEDCDVGCEIGSRMISSDNSKSMGFIMLGIASVIGLGIYYKITTIGKYETFSLRCKHCGGFTRGLKCIFCEQKSH